MIKLDCSRVIKDPRLSCYWLAYPGTRAGTSASSTLIPFPLIDGNIGTDHGLIPDNKAVIISIQRVVQHHEIFNNINIIRTFMNIKTKI